MNNLLASTTTPACHDIFLRAYTVPLEENKPQKKKHQPEPKWPNNVLVFDCESRRTTDQNLTFGSWQFLRIRDGRYVSFQEGIFYDENEVSPKELAQLVKYAKNAKPETVEDGDWHLHLCSRSEFVARVPGRAIQAKALIVGFNLGFDLSRLAVDWSTAKNGGWSLVFSQWQDPRTKAIVANKFFPRIIIKALNSKTALISSTRAPRSEPKVKGAPVELWPKGRFLDLRTLLWALTNKSYSLKTACEKFNIPGKLDHIPSGRVDMQEIEYCRQDVTATVGLLNAAKQEFDLHPILGGPDRMFSPASVAKAYLEKLAISYPSQKVAKPEKAYGICMQSYYGGRAECRIRNVEVPVCPVDFMSQYPTVNELLDNWAVLTADGVTFDDATDSVRQLLSRITLENCFDRKLWPNFKFFALIRPDNDILPVRTFYNGTTQNIGVNYLTSAKPVWFAGPDIIASMLLTGKVPFIENAIRVVPHGKQEGLKATSLRSMVNVDSNSHSFFRHVIEQRAVSEPNLDLHYWLKILASSGSYGLFVEMNPNEADVDLKVFSGEDFFETTSDLVEQPGKWFAPHIASLITSGGRLLLGMLEKCIADFGGTYLFCDTDSAAIVSTPRRKSIEMLNDAPPITALSWAEVDMVVSRFESLNPYDRKLVKGSILKIHKLNWDKDKDRRQLFGYGIAAKRYALYGRSENEIEIIDPKSHGLGYCYPPKDSPKQWCHEVPLWVFEAWEWIVRGTLGLKRKRPEWFDLPVMMRLSLSTPHHVLRNIAKGPVTRPHNFMMLPQICDFGYPQGINPEKFTLIAPFSSKRNEWMRSKCINVHDQNSPLYELANEYDGRRPLPKTFSMLLDSYQNHPEAKSLGPDGKPCEFDTRGLLQRAHIIATDQPIYIGKESDRHWEQGDDLSLLRFNAVQYTRRGKAIADAGQLTRIANVAKREFIRRGISQHTLEKICRREPVSVAKVAKCMKVVEEYQLEKNRA